MRIFYSKAKNTIFEIWDHTFGIFFFVLHIFELNEEIVLETRNFEEHCRIGSKASTEFFKKQQGRKFKLNIYCTFILDLYKAYWTNSFSSNTYFYIFLPYKLLLLTCLLTTLLANDNWNSSLSQYCIIIVAKLQYFVYCIII